MLSTRDQLQFEPGYRLEYSKAKEEEENSGSLGEAGMATANFQH